MIRDSIRVHTRLHVIKLTLLFVWAALTGSYTGWQNPLLTWTNLIIWAAMVVWAARLMLADYLPSRPDNISLAVQAIIAAMSISTILTGQWSHGLIKMAVWIGYLAIYQIADPDMKTHRAAQWALAIYAPLGLVGPFNDNVVAFNLVALGLLAIPAVPNAPMLLAWLFISAIWLQSWGAIMAILVAVAVYMHTIINYKRLVMILAAMLAVLFAGWIFNQSGYSYRLMFWADAWRGFLANPIVGLGPGMYYTLNDWPHAHNWLLTLAAECGLIGIVTGFAMIWAVKERISQQKITWATAVILALAVWSMVDEPLHFWLPGSALMIGLAYGKNTTAGRVT